MQFYKKVKQYVSPIIFSLCFFASYIILGVLLETVLPPGDYAGLFYAGLALIIWICLVMPIYCFKYSKLIYEEKHKSFFIIYNSLVITLCSIAPFLIPCITNGSTLTIIYIAFILFGWVTFWTYISYLRRKRSTEEPDESDSN